MACNHFGRCIRWSDSMNEKMNWRLDKIEDYSGRCICIYLVKHRFEILKLEAILNEGWLSDMSGICQFLNVISLRWTKLVFRMDLFFSQKYL